MVFHLLSAHTLQGFNDHPKIALVTLRCLNKKIITWFDISVININNFQKIYSLVIAYPICGFS
jgi:hypothetical protein